MIDALAIGAHPDDIEFFCGGTLLLLKKKGYKTGIVDLTRGENGSLGSPEERQQELSEASKKLGLDERRQLDLGDGHLLNSVENRYAIIHCIRELKPQIVFTFQPGRRHPDHEHCSQVVHDAVFLSSTKNILPDVPAHRVRQVWKFPELWIQQTPDRIVDISSVYEEKVEMMKCFKSQVLTEEDGEGGETLIKSRRFWDLHETRARQAGALSDCHFGEPFYIGRVARTTDPIAELPQDFK